jgi:hypothetical protein
MSIWETLSKVNCSEKIEKKGKLSYLSWTWAWAEVMNRYPSATYEFQQPVFFNDGSCEVWVSVTIDELTHAMWLPVMDNRNNSVINPDSRKISDARMRCLTKCLAMFGLGHYIYAGEDLPDGEELPVTLTELDKQWIDAVRQDAQILEQLTDQSYKAFIKAEAEK